MKENEIRDLIEDLTFLKTKRKICPQDLTLFEFREIRKIERKLKKLNKAWEKF